MSFVENIIRAGQRKRYSDAVAVQGFAFIELRTPPESLTLGERPRAIRYPDGPVGDADRLHILPPAELFGESRHPWTASVLDGSQPITWGWPEVDRG
jgi:hypothetical protein